MSSEERPIPRSPPGPAPPPRGSRTPSARPPGGAAGNEESGSRQGEKRVRKTRASIHVPFLFSDLAPPAAAPATTSTPPAPASRRTARAPAAGLGARLPPRSGAAGKRSTSRTHRRRPTDGRPGCLLLQSGCRSPSRRPSSAAPGAARAAGPIAGAATRLAAPPDRRAREVLPALVGPAAVRVAGLACAGSGCSLPVLLRRRRSR